MIDWAAVWDWIGALLVGLWNVLWVGQIVTIVTVTLVALAIAWIFHRVLHRIVDRIVNGVKKGQQTDDTQVLNAISPLAAVRVVQRTRTLGSVLGNIANVVIGIIAVSIILTRIAPDLIGSLALLTAALGAGLGFGAQNIVKDVLNGLFMVVEDQLGVGDVVDMGPATGVVEGVGIRITKIRDVNGTLWFVRNGEVVRLGNMSQGWARVIIDLAVPYDTDIDAVEDLMKKTADGMADSAKWRSRILERPELWGLESISAEALVVRIVVKTRTSAKDDVARELRMRLKRALDAEGIRLPALNSIVLSGFERATSVRGVRPPSTSETTIQTSGKASTKTAKPRTPKAPNE